MHESATLNEILDIDLDEGRLGLTMPCTRPSSGPGRGRRSTPSEEALVSPGGQPYAATPHGFG